MIAIVDYKMGNLRSVENALKRLGAEFCITADPAIIRAADKVLLPGVGNAAEAMDNLRAASLVDVVRSLRRPVLGICVGMQVMCRHSEEGDVDCLNLFDARVKRFAPSADSSPSAPIISNCGRRVASSCFLRGERLASTTFITLLSRGKNFSRANV